MQHAGFQCMILSTTACLNMIICNSRKYIFIHLHKTGGSSFEIAAEPTLAWNDLLLGSTETGEILNKYYSKRHRLAKHSSLSDVTQVCGVANIEDYRYLTLVRHPIKRAISLYRFVETIISGFCQRKGVSLSQIKEQHEIFIKQYEVLRWPASRAYVMSEGDHESYFTHAELDKEVGMQSQITQISVNGAIPSQLRIVRLEDIKQAGSIFKDFTGKELEIPHSNKSRTKPLTDDDLSASVKDYLYARFKVDLDRFNYE